MMKSVILLLVLLFAATAFGATTITTTTIATTAANSAAATTTAAATPPAAPTTTGLSPSSLYLQVVDQPSNGSAGTPLPHQPSVRVVNQDGSLADLKSLAASNNNNSSSVPPEFLTVMASLNLGKMVFSKETCRNNTPPIIINNGTSPSSPPPLPPVGDRGSVMDWESFEIDGVWYLAGATYSHGYYTVADSVILRFDPNVFAAGGGNSGWVEHQRLLTRGAVDFEHFVLTNYSTATTTTNNNNNQTTTTAAAAPVVSHFLAVANHYDSDTFSFSTNSSIFRWNRDINRFVLAASVPTNGATSWKAISLMGELRLVVSSMRSDFAVNGQTDIYGFDGATSTLVHLQTLPTSGALESDGFTVDGQTYLMILNHHSPAPTNSNSNNNNNSSSSNNGNGNGESDFFTGSGCAFYRWDGIQFSLASYLALFAPVDAEIFVAPWGKLHLAVTHYDSATGELILSLFEWDEAVSRTFVPWVGGSSSSSSLPRGVGMVSTIDVGPQLYLMISSYSRGHVFAATSPILLTTNSLFSGPVVTLTPEAAEQQQPQQQWWNSVSNVTEEGQVAVFRLGGHRDLFFMQSLPVQFTRSVEHFVMGNNRHVLVAAETRGPVEGSQVGFSMFCWDNLVGDSSSSSSSAAALSSSGYTTDNNLPHLIGSPIATISINTSLAIFTDLGVNLVGKDYVLIFSSFLSLETTTSAPFSIEIGTPTRLVLLMQPSDGRAGSPLSTQPVIATADAGGNVLSPVKGKNILNDQGFVVVTVQLRVAPTSERLRQISPSGLFAANNNTIVISSQPSSSSSFPAGIGGFTDLAVLPAGTGLQLVFTAPGFDNVTSLPFSISAAPAAAMVLVTPPGNATGGSRFAVQPMLALVDSFWNPQLSAVTPFFVSVTAFLNQSLAGACGGNYSGGGGGVAAADSTAATAATTGATKLAATTVVTTTTAAATTTNNKRDANNKLRAVGDTTTAAVAGGDSGNSSVPAPVFLLGTTTVAFVGGFAQFTDLVINMAGIYTFEFKDATPPPPVASSNSTASSTSSTNNSTSSYAPLLPPRNADLTVNFGPPATVRIGVQPDGASGGVPFLQQPVVVLLDAGGNLVCEHQSGIIVVATIASQNLTRPPAVLGSGVEINPAPLVFFGAANITAIRGVAAFSDLGLTTSGIFSLFFHVEGVAATSAFAASNVRSAPFTVAVGPPVAIFVGQEPSSIAVAASAFAIQPVVILFDMGGNIAVVESELANYYNALNKTSSSSSSSYVAPPSLPRIVVEARDVATGRLVPFLHPTAGPVPNVTVSSTPVGAAYFTNLAIGPVGSYFLNFTVLPSPLSNTPSFVISTASSNSISIVAGPPVGISISTQPNGGVGGQTLSNQPTVTLLDAGGNLASIESAISNNLFFYVNVTLGSVSSVFGDAAPPPTLIGTTSIAPIILSSSSQVISPILSFVDLAINTAGNYSLVFTLFRVGGDNNNNNNSSSAAPRPSFYPPTQVPSATFAVVVGPAARLQIVRQAASASAFYPFFVQPQIGLVDLGGNPILLSSTAGPPVITVTLTDLLNKGAKLSGGVSITASTTISVTSPSNPLVTFSRSIANFTDLTIDATGDYVLQFSSTGYTPISSPTLSVFLLKDGPTSATKSYYLGLPPVPTAVAGVPFKTKVQTTDSFGNRRTSASSVIFEVVLIPVRVQLPPLASSSDTAAINAGTPIYGTALDIADGTINITVTASFSGLYNLTARDSGTGVRADGGRYVQLTVVAGPPAALGTTPTVSPSAGGSIVAGGSSPLQISVVPRDIFGNEILQGATPPELSYLALIAMTSTLGESMKLAGNATLGPRATFSLPMTLAGSFSITVLQNARELISGTPIAFSVTPGSLSVPASTVDGATAVVNATNTFSLGSSSAGTAASFLVKTRDSYGNVRTSSPGLTFEFIFSGPILPLSATIADPSDGTLVVSATLTVSGDYSVTVRASGVQVMNSASLRYRVNAATVAPAACTVVLGTGFSQGFSGTNRTITTLPRDAFSNIITGSAASAIAFSASLLNTDTSSGGGVVDTRSIPGGQSVQYAITASGSYALHILLNGQAVLSSPFALVVTTGFANAAASVIRAAGGVIGQPAYFYVRVKDAYGNNRASALDFPAGSAGGGSFRGVALPDVTGAISGWSFSTATGEHTSSITAAQAGDYNVTVVFRLGDSKTFIMLIVSSVGDPVAANSLVSGTGLSRATAGVSTSVSVQLRSDLLINLNSGAANGGTWGAMSASIVTGTSTPKTVTGVDNKDGTYTITYVLTTAATYSMTVTFQNVVIAGGSSSTPATIIVSPGAVSGATTVAAGSGLSVGTAGVARTFTITPSDAFGNKISYSPSYSSSIALAAKLITTTSSSSSSSSSGGDSSAATTSLQYLESGAGVFAASWTSTVSGNFILSVLVASSSNAHISGSPFTVAVATSAAVAERSSASGVGLSSLNAGTSGGILLQPRDSFGNLLPSSAASAMQIVISTAATGQNTGISPVRSATVAYTFDWMTTTAGSYLVSITQSSVHIPGSPFTAVVAPLVTSAATCLFNLSQMANPQAFVSMTSILTARDVYGNVRTVGGDAFVVDMGSASATLSDRQDGTYWITATPPSAGTYALTATLGGTLIGPTAAPYFPLTIVVGPGPPTLSTCIVLGSGLSSAIAGNTASIRVTSRDAARSLRTAGTDVFIVQLASSSRNVQLGCSWTASTKDYDCSYTMTTSGSYKVGVYLDAVQSTKLVGSVQYDVTIAPGPVTARGSSASGDSLNTATGATAGSAVRFVVTGGDNLGNPGIYDRYSKDVYSFTVNTVRPVSVTSTSTVSSTVAVVNNLDGTFSVAFTPTISASMTVNVLWNGLQHIAGSPFTLPIRPAVLRVGSCSASGAGISSATAGVAASLVIRERDVYGNNVNSAGTSVFTASFARSVSVGEAAQTSDDVVGVFSTDPDTSAAGGGGLSSISYSLQTAGTWFVSVKSSGVHVSGSPFSVKVVPGPVSAPQCTADGNALVAGLTLRTSTFTIYARDRYSNQLTSSTGLTFAASLSDGTTASIISNLQNPGTFISSYTIQQSGTVSISVTLSGSHIHNSPFSPRYSRDVQDISATRSVISSPSQYAYGVAGQSTVISVQIRDLSGVDVYPSDIPTASVVGTLAGTSVPLTKASTTYDLTFASTVSGSYSSLITVNSATISGGQFTFTVVPASTSSAASTYTFINTSPLIAGNDLIVAVVARDSYSNIQQYLSATGVTDSFAVTVGTPAVQAASGVEARAASTINAVTSYDTTTSTHRYTISTVTLAGTYSLRVRLSSTTTTTTTTTSSGPTSLVVSPAVASMTDFMSIGNSGPFTSGVSASFAIIARDAFGNRIVGTSAPTLINAAASSSSGRRATVQVNTISLSLIVVAPSTMGIVSGPTISWSLSATGTTTTTTTTTSSSDTKNAGWIVTMLPTKSSFQHALSIGQQGSQANVVSMLINNGTNTIMPVLPAETDPTQTWVPPADAVSGQRSVLVRARDKYSNDQTSGGLSFVTLMKTVDLAITRYVAGITVTDNSDGSYTVAYSNAKVVGNYDLSIKRFDTHILGSPFRIFVGAGLPDAASMPATFTFSGAKLSGLDLMTAGTAATFTITSVDSNGNLRSQTTDDDTGRFSVVSVSDSGNGTVSMVRRSSTSAVYTGSLYMKVAGASFSVVVGVSGTALSGMPIRVAVVAGSVSAASSVVRGNCLAPSQCGSGADAVIEVLPRDAYGNSISSGLGPEMIPVAAISMRSSSGAWTNTNLNPINAVPNCDLVRDMATGNKYSCGFGLGPVGIFDLAVTIGGISVGGVDSYSYTVATGSIDASSCALYGGAALATDTNGVAGVKRTFWITAADTYGNALSTGGASFVVGFARVDPVSGDIYTVDSDSVTVVDNNNGTYLAQYTITSAAAYTMSVTFLDRHLRSSPVAGISIAPGSISGASCTAAGAALAGGATTRAEKFAITQRDSYGNIIYVAAASSASSLFSVTVTPTPDSGPIFGNFDTKSGEWTVSYTYNTAQSSAQVAISFIGDAASAASPVAITSSPFTGIVWIQTLGAANPAKTYITGPSVVVDGDTRSIKGFTDSNVVFLVQTVNSDGINLVGDATDPAESDFTVIVEGPVSALGTVTKRGTSDGIYVVQFPANIAGTYRVMIMLSLVPIGPNGDGVFDLEVSPGVANATMTLLSSSSSSSSSESDSASSSDAAAVTFSMVAGEDQSFSLTVRDANGNVRSTGAETVGLISVNTSSPLLSVSIIEALGSQPRGVVSATAAGTYTFRVLLGGQVIGGTNVYPAVVTVTAASTSSAECLVSPTTPTVTSVAGNGLAYTIQSRDMYGNVRLDGTDIFRVIVAPKVGASTTSNTITVESTFNSTLGASSAVFYPLVVGTFSLTVQRKATASLWEDVGSSLAEKKSLIVVAGATDPSSSLVLGIKDTRAGTPIEVCVRTYDKLGNMRRARDEAANFALNLVPPASATVAAPAKVFMSPAAVGSTNEDTACGTINYEGIATVSLSVLYYPNGPNGTFTHMKGSPFNVVFDSLAAPALVSAQFTDSVGSIVVNFDKATNRAGLVGTFSCSSLLSSVTVATLGTSPMCSWNSDTQFSIVLGVGATIRPSTVSTDSIELKSGLTPPLLNSAGNSAAASGSTLVLLPTNPPTLSITLGGASKLPSCGSVSLDASDSSGGGGRALTFTWGVQPGVPNDVDLQAALAALGGVTVLKLSADDTAKYLEANVEYTFFIRVSNFLGFSVEATKTIVRAAVSVPRIYIQGDKERSVDRSSVLRLEGYASLSSCSNSSSSDSSSSNSGKDSINFEWSVISTKTFTVDTKTRNSRQLKITTGDLEVGATYTVQLKGSLASDPTIYGTDTMTLTVAALPIKVSIAGGSRSVSPTSALTVDASKTSDPDNLPTLWVYQWECAKLVSKTVAGVTSVSTTDCPDAAMGEVFSNKATLNFTANVFEAGQTYRFTLTAIKEPGPRKDSASVELKMKSNSKSSSSDKKRSIGSSSSSDILSLRATTTTAPDLNIDPLSTIKVNRNDRLLLSARENNGLALRDMTWSVVSGDVVAGSYIVLSPAASRFLLLAPNSLIAGQTYRFQFTARLDSAGSSGELSDSSLDVVVNKPPTGGFCYGVNTTSSAANGTQVGFTVSLRCEPLFTDDPSDYPLFYRWDRVEGFSWPSPSVRLPFPSPSPTSVDAANMTESAALETWASSLAPNVSDPTATTTYNPLSQRSASAVVAAAVLGAPEEVNAAHRVLLRACCFDKYEAAGCVHTIIIVPAVELPADGGASALDTSIGEGDAAGTFQLVSSITKSAQASSSRRRRRLLGSSTFSRDEESKIVSAISTAASNGIMDKEFCQQGLRTQSDFAAHMSDISDSRSLSTMAAFLQTGSSFINNTASTDSVVEKSTTTVAAKALETMLKAQSSGVVQSTATHVDTAVGMLSKTLSNAESSMLPGMPAKTIQTDKLALSTAVADATKPGSMGNLTLSGGGSFAMPNGSTPVSPSGTVAVRMRRFDPSMNPHNARGSVPGGNATSPLISLAFSDASSGLELPVMLNSTNSTPIVITLPTLFQGQTADVLTCNFWNEKNNSYSRKGCISIGRVSGSTGDVLCACFHLTDFSGAAETLLPKVTVVDPIAGAQAFKKLSAKQIAIITAICFVLFLLFIGIIIGERRDRRDFEAFAKDPAGYINKLERDAELKRKNGISEAISNSEFFQFAHKSLRTRHALVQIFYSRPYSSMSRPQIITSFMVYMLTTMMVNALFYSAARSSLAQSIIVGIWSGLLTFPVTFFFHFMFKKVRRYSHERARSSYALQADRSSKLEEIKAANQRVTKISESGGDSTSVIVAPMAAGAAGAAGAGVGGFPQPTAGSQVARAVPAAPSAVATIDAAGAAAAAGKDPQWVKQLSAIMSARKAAQIWRKRTARKRNGAITTGLRSAFGDLRSTEFVRLTDHSESKMPTNMQYYVYFVAFCYISFAAYINILYGISFPEELASRWLLSTGYSTGQSLLISDPLKILVLTAIFIVIRRTYVLYRQRRIEAAINNAMAAAIPMRPEGYRPPDNAKLFASTPRLGTPGGPGAQQQLGSRGVRYLGDDTPKSGTSFLRLKSGGFLGRAGSPASTPAKGQAVAAAALQHASRGELLSMIAREIVEDTEVLNRKKPMTMSVGHYCPRPGVLFEFTRLDLSFSGMLTDTNIQPGALHWLGSQLGAASYDPATWSTGLVTCNNPAADTQKAWKMIGSRQPEEMEPIRGTKEIPPWICVDLGEGRAVIPKHYALRHGSKVMDNTISNWCLQGSMDGVGWTVLSDHHEEAPFLTSFGVQVWPIESLTPSRFFRIVVTGRNLSNNFDLCLGGFEIYGGMITAAAATEVMNELALAEDTWDSVVSPFDVAHGAAVLEPPVAVFRTCHVSNFDQNGILYMLGSHNHTRNWRNPAETGEVVVTHSDMPYPLCDGNVASVTSIEAASCVTSGRRPSWFRIDFGPGRAVAPTAYTLRHGFGISTMMLRNWELQGSNDGTNWDTLRSHYNDLSLNSGFGCATFPVLVYPRKAFRFLRILQTGVNSSKNHRLACGGLEFYGTYVVVPGEEGSDSNNNARNQTSVSLMYAAHFGAGGTSFVDSGNSLSGLSSPPVRQAPPARGHPASAAFGANAASDEFVPISPVGRDHGAVDMSSHPFGFSEPSPPQHRQQQQQQQQQQEYGVSEQDLSAYMMSIMQELQSEHNIELGFRLVPQHEDPSMGGAITASPAIPPPARIQPHIGVAATAPPPAAQPQVRRPVVKAAVTSSSVASNNTNNAGGLARYHQQQQQQQQQQQHRM